jgi:hypothetical protein
MFSKHDYQVDAKMKRKNFLFKCAICFFSVAATLTMVTTKDVVNAQNGNIEAEDNCMKIAVDSSQKMDRLPDVFKSSASPKAGHVFLVAELSIKEIKCGYIFFKTLTDRIVLYDNNSKIYPLFKWRVEKFQYEDPHDLTSSIAFVEGSILTIVFEIPLQSNLASIKYTYDYGSSWADYDSSSRATIILGESILPRIKPMPWISSLLLDKTEPAWVTIMSENFEGSFPSGAWSFLGNPTWAVDEYKPHDGEKSAWCAKGGTLGIEPETNNYANQMAAWMIYGPFDLSDASNAELVFYLWLNSESEHDYFQWMASTNGTNFYGLETTGNKNGWIKEVLDLKSVYTIGNLCGESKVWIAFIFESDSSVTNKGAFVDDILLRKKVKQ